MSSNQGNIRIKVQPPPGEIVAPNGFPADPRPAGAPQEFLDAMQIRIKVFCDEQNCAIEPELDEDDLKSWSWIAYQTLPGIEEETPIATIRLTPPPHSPHPNGFEDPNEEPYIKLSRVATLAQARGQKLTTILMEAAFSYLSSNPDLVGSEWKGLVLTHAQVYVEGMYIKLGFVTDNRLGRWDEEGIEHLGMWKKLTITNTQA